MEDEWPFLSSVILLCFGCGKNTQTSVLLVSSVLLRRVWWSALQRSPQLPAQKVRTIFPKWPSRRTDPQSRLQSRRICRHGRVQWPRIAGGAWFLCLVMLHAGEQKLRVTDLGSSCLAFKVPLWDAVVQTLKAPQFLPLKLVFWDHLGNKTVPLPSHHFSKGAEQTVSYRLPWGMLMLSSFVNPVILT